MDIQQDDLRLFHTKNGIGRKGPQKGLKRAKTGCPEMRLEPMVLNRFFFNTRKRAEAPLRVERALGQWLAQLCQASNITTGI